MNPNLPATTVADVSASAPIGSPLTPWVVLLVIPARFVFSILAQALTALVLWAGGLKAQLNARTGRPDRVRDVLMPECQRSLAI